MTDDDRFAECLYMEASSDLRGDLAARTEFDGDFKPAFEANFIKKKYLPSGTIDLLKNGPGIFSRKEKIVPAFRF
jgi:hypothetical protein